MKSYRALWSIWFVSLTAAAIGLIILTIKLMEDRKSLQAKEAEAQAFIQSIENMLEIESEKVALAKWSAMTNLTEKSRSTYEYNLFNYDKLVREIKLNMSELPWETFKKSRLRRKFYLFLRSPRISLLQPTKTATLNAVKSKIVSLQYNAVVPGGEINLAKANFSEIEQSERIKKYNWLKYNEMVGEESKIPYTQYVQLMNENAVLSEFPDALNYWISSEFEMEPKILRKIVYKLWDQIKPHFQDLHAYIVDEMRSRTPRHATEGFIPAQLIETAGITDGSWSSLFESFKPYPNRSELNITAELHKMKYSPQSMAKLTEDFFASNNFPTMRPDFWSESLFRHSPRTQMDCRPTLYKISNNEKQLRISLCGEKDETTFRTINKLMTRAKFAMLRKDEPFLFRYEPNSVTAVASEEAVQMFLTRRNRLRNLGFLQDFEDDIPTTVNFLFQEALELLPRMAHSLAFDQWNAGVFGGNIKPKQYNCKWWAIRQHREGIEPPSRRRSMQFDPARSGFLTLPPSAPLQYFVSSVMKFQLYNGLTKASEVSEEENMVNKYDVGSESTEFPIDTSLSLTSKAGNLLNAMLRVGSSKPWQTSMKEIFNESELNLKPLLDYFEPLFTFLKERAEAKGYINSTDWKTNIKNRVICSSR